MAGPARQQVWMACNVDGGEFQENSCTGIFFHSRYTGTYFPALECVRKRMDQSPPGCCGGRHLESGAQETEKAPAVIWRYSKPRRRESYGKCATQRRVEET